MSLDVAPIKKFLNKKTAVAIKKLIKFTSLDL
jgi:hypothetical protein